jgi:hypothetical protein
MPTSPRDGSQVLGGLPWLARMIDKARLEASGEIKQFDLDYPCPMDQRLLAQLGIDGKAFQKIVIENSSDEGILEALKAQNALPV